MDENDKKLDNYLDYVVFNSTDETIVKAKKKKPYKYKKKAKRANQTTSRNIICVKNIEIAAVNKLPVTSRVNELTIISNEGSCDSEIKEEARQIEQALTEDISQESADYEVNEEIIEDVNEIMVEDVNESMVVDVNESMFEDVNKSKVGDVNKSIVVEVVNETVAGGGTEIKIEDVNENIIDDVNEVLIENANEESIELHEGDNSNIMEVEMLDDLYESHEVINMAGCEYVTVGGTLYKVLRE